MKQFKLFIFIFLFLATNCKKTKKPFTRNDIVEFYTFTNTTKRFEDYKVRRFIINKFNDNNDSLIKNFVEEKFNEIDILYNKINIVIKTY